MHWRSLNNIEFSLLFLFLIRINWFEIRQGKKKQPTKHKLNTLMRILSFYVRKCFFFKESQLFSAFSAFTLDSLNISWYFMEEKKSNWSLELKRCKMLELLRCFWIFVLQSTLFLEPGQSIMEKNPSRCIYMVNMYT